eukprot:SAG31_NODE_14164_length_824_cov_0.991724_1_plen_206_part_10
MSGVVITSDAGRRCNLLSPWAWAHGPGAALVQTRDGAAVEVSWRTDRRGSILHFATRVGETYAISPSPLNITAVYTTKTLKSDDAEAATQRGSRGPQSRFSWATVRQEPLAALQPHMLTSINKDREGVSEHGQLPGSVPPNLKWLGAWNANDYPNYPVKFLNLGLQDAYQFLGPNGDDPSKLLDMSALKQAMASAAAGQSVLIRVE